jgi:hypothetical protein
MTQFFFLTFRYAKHKVTLPNLNEFLYFQKELTKVPYYLPLAFHLSLQSVL